MSFKIHSQRRRTKVFNTNIYFQVSCFSVLGVGFHELPEYFGPLHVLGSSKWVVVAVACCTAHNLYTTCENKNIFYVPKKGGIIFVILQFWVAKMGSRGHWPWPAVLHNTSTVQYNCQELQFQARNWVELLFFYIWIPQMGSPVYINSKAQQKHLK